jgi:major vault protein
MSTGSKGRRPEDDYEEKQMEERNRQRDRELVLTSNEFAYVLDTTKGQIDIYVGPHKKDLAATDRLVIFNQKTKRFETAGRDDAVQLFWTAPANWYVVLKNPAKNGDHPPKGAYSQLSPLLIGKKVNLHGPVSFAAWPGQMARVIQGHALKTNQYVVARIYDAAEANQRKNEVLGGVGETGSDVGGIPDFVNGQKLVIKGTDISFYMPPTGVEVIPETFDGKQEYVREAVTLQRLEYCILISEDGEKHFLRGEDVVFPRPNQEFVAKDGKRKFKALELSEISGLYVKVIAPYVDEDGVERTEGEELFITGKDKIYFPRKEHAVIQYGDHDINYAVAIPRGEGRYVLNRQTGEVKLVRGPQMFLPDPRFEIITQKVLTDRECDLMYPGNEEVLSHNRDLRGAARAQAGDTLAESLSNVRSRSHALKSYNLAVPVAAAISDSTFLGAAAEGWAGDAFSRKKEHTKPRTVLLDNKFDGAVSIDVWSGFAMMTVDKAGGRRVIRGPQNGVLLEYDETIEALHLSRGVPKSSKDLLHTAFLKTTNNYVSDQIGVITSDMVMVQIQVKYLVDFEGDDPEKWFAVDNYVKLLTDRGRSMVKAMARKTMIADLQRNVAELIRDTILGKQDETGKRRNMLFEENGMKVCDVDVLYFKITTSEVADLLFKTQNESVRAAIDVSQREALLENQKRLQRIERELEAERHQTLVAKAELADQRQKIEHAGRELAAFLKSALVDQQLLHEKQVAVSNGELAVMNRDIQRAQHELDMLIQGDEQALREKDLDAKVQAVVAQAQAFSPELTAALNRLGDVQALSAIAENFGELAGVEAKGLLETAKKYLDFGTAVRLLPSLKDQQ